MELPEELLRGIYSYGFEKPSAIQQRAIKPTISGRDLIAQAQSGTVSLIRYFCVFRKQNKENKLLKEVGLVVLAIVCSTYAKEFRDEDFLLTIFRV